MRSTSATTAAPGKLYIEKRESLKHPPPLHVAVHAHHTMALPCVGALLVKKLRAEAVVPSRAHATDAGYDLSSVATVIIQPGKRGLVPTGIACAIPHGTYARVAPRSGLAVKHGIQVGAGVVDSAYRGEVCVVLFNHGEAVFEVKPGDRVAQLILEKIATPPVSEVDELPPGDRGTAGFGSTGFGA